MRDQINMTPCEEIAELCALATTETLTREEWKRMESHVAKCGACEQRWQQYRELISSGISAMAAEEALDNGIAGPTFSVAVARDRLLAAMQNTAPDIARSHEPVRIDKDRSRRFIASRNLVPIAAALILAVGLAYRVGIKVGLKQQVSNQTEIARAQLSNILSQKTNLESELGSTTQRVSQLRIEAEVAEKQVADLRSAKSNLEARILALTEQAGQQSASIAAANSERAALEQKLRDGEALLHAVRQQLHSSEDDHHQLQLRATSLEMQVEHLTSQLDEQQNTSTRQQQFLAQDRDIRELMGARQLYIADVFDVDSQGNNRKAYGRIFFTEGKSLIFYAFDLDKQPGYRNANTFQAWGQPSAGQTSPVSLGIFYMDSEANRRWVLQASNPKVLEQISAVFVTVEPKGGSKKPTNRPFLLAYLHATPPNHP